MGLVAAVHRLENQVTNGVMGFGSCLEGQLVVARLAVNQALVKPELLLFRKFLSHYK